MDTTGLLLAVVVHAASIQDRDGAKLVNRFPRLQVIWADAAYTGRLVAWALATGGWLLSVVRRNRTATASRYCPAGGWWSAPWPG